jgi:hypothetical protein
LLCGKSMYEREREYRAGEEGFEHAKTSCGLVHTMVARVLRV